MDKLTKNDGTNANKKRYIENIFIGNKKEVEITAKKYNRLLRILMAKKKKKCLYLADTLTPLALMLNVFFCEI